ncbi:pyridoxamine 5'-phosphate oxidase [Paludisphaera rhizosphaerae]|uniref:pyridoxamine 5'-phosphate oxidase n=1 Tax=Paludisphaera rhizosphaerae TaxID=2711216 RepID=UPI0013EC0235|nr:pyridoxamine 5'-phosphate oxidase [Paludisphaera rhizosphaerae]
MSLSDIRTDYKRHTLDENDLNRDPIRQFEAWFAEALAAEVPEVNAATLATATPDGRPSARIVLLKGCDPRGFTFFTNYESRKGRHLAANPRASLLFFWKELERQVSIEGTVEKVTAEESEAYFHSRPVASQVGAWASKQSEVIADRESLEDRFCELAEKFANAEVPRPEYWGGYRILPESLEFWQGRPSRLHDRLRYQKDAAGAWTIERLSP